MTRESDYITREYRKRDLQVYRNQLQSEQVKYNETLKLQNKTFHEEKLSLKPFMVEVKTLKDIYFNKILEHNKDLYDKALEEFLENLRNQLKDQFFRQYNNKDYIRRLDEDCKIQQIEVKKQKERDAAREKREKERRDKQGYRPEYKPRESNQESMANISLVGLSKLT